MSEPKAFDGRGVEAFAAELSELCRRHRIRVEHGVRCVGAVPMGELESGRYRAGRVARYRDGEPFWSDLEWEDDQREGG